MAEDSGVNAIEKGLFAALNVAGITGTVPAARHYNMLVPTDSAFPAITIQLMDSNREGASFSEDAQTYDYLVKAIDKGDHSVTVVGDAADAIDTALHGGTISVTGATVYAVKRQRHVRFMEYDDQRQPIVHAGAVYRIWEHP